jgi:DNA polymerase-3 subunit epsilon
MFAVVDIETTGGNHRTGRIIEIAAVLFDGERIVNTFESLVNPGTSLPPFITSLTGINNEMLKKAPPFYNIAERFLNFTKETVFVAHNVPFDYNYIKTEFRNIGYEFERECLCTLKESRKLFPAFSSHGLENLSRQFCIKNKDRHRAMGDAMVTLELLKIILEEKKLYIAI